MTTLSIKAISGTITIAVQRTSTASFLNQGNFGNDNNRGAAYLDGQLFRGTADGRMIALRAKDGKFLWENLNADQGKAESFIAAPIAWDNKVFRAGSRRPILRRAAG
jgi:outer membrane protein assembly factor BamB